LIQHHNITRLPSPRQATNAPEPSWGSLEAVAHPARLSQPLGFQPRIYYRLFGNSTPPAPWELAIGHFLLERGHDIELIRSVLDQAREQGSVERCESLGDLDRAAIEDLLPDAPARSWGQYPDRWALTE
jgi:hypothetical protein